MPLLKLTARVARNFHSPAGTKPRAEREYIAQAVSALPFYSPLASAWTGFIKLSDGALAINDNSRARSKATRLGFVIEGGGAAT